MNDLFNVDNDFLAAQKNALSPLVKALGESVRSSVNPKYKYCCELFTLNDPAQRQKFTDIWEKITTDPENYRLHQEETTFTKTGQYMVVLRWVEKIATPTLPTQNPTI